MTELIDAFDQVDADDNVRAVIVTGAGRAFCAGADLAAGGDTFSDGKLSTEASSKFRRDGGGTVTLRMFKCNKPIIGALNGAGVGIGVTMTLPMDIRIAADTAKFGFVFTRRGDCPRGVLLLVPATHCWHPAGSGMGIHWSSFFGSGGTCGWFSAQHPPGRRVDERGSWFG